MKFRHKYEYSHPFSAVRHMWVSIGVLGAVHFHVTDMGEAWERDHGERYSGGLEFHHRSPPEHARNDAPSQDRCWVLQAPCWHDGTSLYASENLIPFWQGDPNNHERMFRRLELEYAQQFDKREEAVS